MDEVERAKLLGEEKIEAIADRVGAVNKEGSDHGREFDSEESKVESVAFAPTTLTVDETGENNNKPVESILSEDENSSEKHNTVSIVIDPKNEDRETEEPTAKKEELNSFFEEEPQRKRLKIRVPAGAGPGLGRAREAAVLRIHAPILNKARGIFQAFNAL